jgi:hypothetical protein
MRLRTVKKILLGALVVLAGAAAQPAGAAIFNVSTAAQLQAAVRTANGNGEDDTIVLAPGVYALSGGLIVGDRFVTLPGETLTLSGPAAGQAVIDGSGLGGDQVISAASPTNVRDLTIRGSGGTTGILANNPVNVERTTLINHELALWTSSGRVNVTNSTISGNEVGILAENMLELLNTTVTSNSEAGVSNFGHVTADNTIIAGNGGDCPDNPIDAGLRNLDRDGTCWGSGASGITRTTPALGPLQDNGGPTPTHALLPGSPALDAGLNSGCPSTDQRGVTRPKNVICDIGAFERALFEFEETSGIVSAGGTLTTDGEGDGATADDPVETAVTHPSGGAIAIREGPDAAAEFGFIGQRVVLNVNPDATAADPLVITFLIDASVIPAGQSHNTIQVFKNGVAVPACTGAGATPDPCVASRQAVGTDAQIVVRTSSASDWDFAPGGPQDSTPPTIALTTPADGAVYMLNQAVTADYACQEEAGGAGLASCVGDVAAGAPIDTSAVGAKTFTVTAADDAGNVSSVTHSYSVVYGFSGFVAPLGNAPAVNAGKAGRTYAVKWQLRDANGTFVSALGAVAGLYVQRTSCSAFASEPIDAEAAATTGGTSLRYDDDSNQYVYNWATPAPGCYTLFLQLDSGQSFPAFFDLS